MPETQSVYKVACPYCNHILNAINPSLGREPDTVMPSRQSYKPNYGAFLWVTTGCPQCGNTVKVLFSYL